MPSFANKARFPGARVIRATKAAILVDVEGEEYWIPQSQVDDDSEIWKQGDEGELVVSEWFAGRAGLV